GDVMMDWVCAVFIGLFPSSYTSPVNYTYTAGCDRYACYEWKLSIEATWRCESGEEHHGHRPEQQKRLPEPMNCQVNRQGRRCAP
ncbi:MAG: hypothetical protein KDE24_31360, partial [Caldilinea sp.]|nr:hypothetical protein [Caldilinea sp.]